MQPPNLLSIHSDPIEHLSPSDRTLLNNIFKTYDNTCIIVKNTRFPSFPAVQHTTIHDFFNEISHVLPIFIEYINCIPEFAKINLDDKIRLLKNHFCIMININEVLMHPKMSKDLIITWTNIFGLDITERLIKRNQLLESYVSDFIVLKLVLIILVLSSSNNRNIDHLDLDLICDDTLSIFAAQNIYVELLWKYILSCSSNEREAVKFLNRLMMCILYVQNTDMYVDGYVDELTDEIKKLEPLIQNMWPNSAGEDHMTHSITSQSMIV